MVPLGMMNRLRRALVDAVLTQLDRPEPRAIDRDQGISLLQPIERSSVAGDDAPRLAVLCRTLEQVRAACESHVDMVYADFHDIRQYGDAVSIARDMGVPIGLGTVRMQKPGETVLLRVLGRHRPDLLLARNLAAIGFGRAESIPTVSDFSLNVSNHRSAEWIRNLGVERVTASYDLNRDQLLDLIESVPADWMEVVSHQHMPMLHMEHSVYCSVLSPGTNKTNSGRPCDHHVVQLRDRVGAEHKLEADVACRNTLYNATAQSGAETVADLIARGTAWFRVELLAEEPPRATETIAAYRQLLNHEISASQVWQSLQASNRIGVTRGTLEPKRNPLEIL